MPIDDREKQFERALAHHLRNASPDSACPNAEILAAYHERTLSLEEMAHWKEHITGCVRCQECLTLVEQTENLPAEEWQFEDVLQSLRTELHHTSLADAGFKEGEVLRSTIPMVHAAPASSVRSISRPLWRLLLPIGAIAAAVIVWVGVREVRTQHFQQLGSMQVAENRAPLPASPASKAELQTELKKEQSPAQSLNKEYQAQKPPVALAPVLVSPPRATAPVARGTVNQNANSSSLSQRDAIAADSLGEAVKKADSQNVPRISAAERSVQASPPRAPQPAPAAASNTATAAQRKDEYLKTPPPAASETVQVQSEAQQLATSGNASEIAPSERAKMIDLAKLAVTNRLYIVAPGEKHAWRVGDGGMIERTTDRGKTWKPQNSGVTAGLTAGSATSDKVCWVIGRGGTLLLTTDGGKHWKLLSSPVKEDLGGIHATDAIHATIWDVPNRKSFETSDGGETWKRAANE
ncbi:MAG: YCF48-related protein [Candidatus Acidiferrum sp.]